MNKIAKLKMFVEVIFKYNLWHKIPGLFRMIAAVIRGKYKPNLKAVLIGIFSIAYILSPIDLMPEILAPIVPFLAPFLLIDDISIFIFGLKKVLDEVENFLIWEKQNGIIIEDAKIVN